MVEGPIKGGRGSWIASVRRSFLDLFMIENRSYRSAHACGEGDVLHAGA